MLTYPGQHHTRALTATVITVGSRLPWAHTHTADGAAGGEKSRHTEDCSCPNRWLCKSKGKLNEGGRRRILNAFQMYFRVAAGDSGLTTRFLTGPWQVPSLPNSLKILFSILGFSAPWLLGSLGLWLCIMVRIQNTTNFL